MRNWLKRIFFTTLLACLASCGGASPPLGIPAPVSSLMTLEGPDVNGTISIIGAPGAVLSDAVVTGTNISLVSHARPWTRWFLNSAVAQDATQSQRIVVAASDGSFRMRVVGKTGDIIRIVQSVDGETSPATDLVVPDTTLNPLPGSTLP